MYIITTILLPFLIGSVIGTFLVPGSLEARIKEGLFIGLLTVALVQLVNLLYYVSWTIE